MTANTELALNKQANLAPIFACWSRFPEHITYLENYSLILKLRLCPVAQFSSLHQQNKCCNSKYTACLDHFQLNHFLTAIKPHQIAELDQGRPNPECIFMLFWLVLKCDKNTVLLHVQPPLGVTVFIGMFGNLAQLSLP